MQAPAFTTGPVREARIPNPINLPNGSSIMRILFSSTPGFGHIAPLIPLVRAGRDAGHEVSLLTSAGMRESIDPDLPLVAAGPMPGVVLAELQRRGQFAGPTGPKGSSAPKQSVGFFAVAAQLAIDEALEKAEQWKPDLIVAERSDLIGPLVADELSVPWARLAIGPAMEADVVEGVAAEIAPLYEERGVAKTNPVAELDLCPPALQARGWTAPEHHVTVRPEPHSQDAGAWSVPPFPGHEDKPLVLVTLGTVFNQTSTLTSVLDSLTALDVRLLVTAGPGVEMDAVSVDPARMRAVDFVPLAQLLEGVDAVVTVGGAGTILGTLSRGIPMVVFPQGADHFRNAARSDAAGAAITVEASGAIATALSRILDEDGFRIAAQSVAAEIDGMSPPAKALEEVLEFVSEV